MTTSYWTQTHQVLLYKEHWLICVCTDSSLTNVFLGPSVCSVCIAISLAHLCFALMNFDRVIATLLCNTAVNNCRFFLRNSIFYVLNEFYINKTCNWFWWAVWFVSQDAGGTAEIMCEYVHAHTCPLPVTECICHLCVVLQVLALQRFEVAGRTMQRAYSRVKVGLGAWYGGIGSQLRTVLVNDNSKDPAISPGSQPEENPKGRKLLGLQGKHLVCNIRLDPGNCQQGPTKGSDLCCALGVG